jgi:hypothetical protein
MATVSVSQQDFLDQDPPLRGQNYVCMSFISPEDIIKQKNVYIFEKFIKNFSHDMTEFFNNLSEKYKDDADLIKTIKERYRYIFDTQKIHDEYTYYHTQYSTQLDKEFNEKVDFQTNIRGIKIRGVFDTLREAEIRAQVLKRIDDKFHVYVGQVGCWCPWSPNPDDIADQEYAETHLNTLMKNYKENQAKKDIFFEERKRELQFSNISTKATEATEATEAAETTTQPGETTPTVSIEESIPDTSVLASFEHADPWMQKVSS